MKIPEHFRWESEYDSESWIYEEGDASEQGVQAPQPDLKPEKSVISDDAKSKEAFWGQYKTPGQEKEVLPLGPKMNIQELREKLLGPDIKKKKK